MNSRYEEYLFFRNDTEYTYFHLTLKFLTLILWASNNNIVFKDQYGNNVAPSVSSILSQLGRNNVLYIEGIKNKDFIIEFQKSYKNLYEYYKKTTH